MSTFERVYQIDASREEDREREIKSIELSDHEHLERLRPRVSKDMEESGLIYKPPVMDEESMSPDLKYKFKKAIELTKDTKVIELSKKDAKSKSKSPKRKSKKDNPKPNSAAVAQVQTEL